MIDNIIMKIEENSQEAFKALKTLNINLFSPFCMQANIENSIFENLITKEDSVFFKNNCKFMFDKIDVQQVNIAVNSILKFKNFERYNDINEEMLNYLYNNRPSDLTNFPQLYLYYTIILEKKSLVDVPVDYYNVYQFLLDYVLAKSSEFMGSSCSLHDVKMKIETVILNLINAKDLYEPEILNLILNELYLTDKKDVMNIVLQIVIKNELCLTDILYDTVKNQIINDFNNHETILDTINQIFYELDEENNPELENDFYNSDIQDANVKSYEENLVEKIKNTITLSQMLKIEASEKLLQERMNRKQCFTYSLQNNIALMDLINEKEKLKKLVNKESESEETGKKRL